jgi:hypothetical protein
MASNSDGFTHTTCSRKCANDRYVLPYVATMPGSMPHLLAACPASSSRVMDTELLLDAPCSSLARPPPLSLLASAAACESAAQSTPPWTDGSSSLPCHPYCSTPPRPQSCVAPSSPGRMTPHAPLRRLPRPPEHAITLAAIAKPSRAPWPATTKHSIAKSNHCTTFLPSCHTSCAPRRGCSSPEPRHRLPPSSRTAGAHGQNAVGGLRGSYHLPWMHVDQASPWPRRSPTVPLLSAGAAIPATSPALLSGGRGRSAAPPLSVYLYVCMTGGPLWARVPQVSVKNGRDWVHVRVHIAYLGLIRFLNFRNYVNILKSISQARKFQKWQMWTFWKP